MGGRFQRRALALAFALLAVPAVAGQQTPQDGPKPSPAEGRPPVDPPVTTLPSWATPPAPEPPPLAAASRSGLVDLACTSQPTGEVTDCTITHETPNEATLGALALAALDAAVMSPWTVDGAAKASPVRFTVQFRSGALPPLVSDPIPPAPDGEPLLTISPSWARQPMPEYPERAAALGVGRGRVMLNCGFVSSGDLTDCQIVDEQPTEAGFGGAAIAGARRGKVSERIVRDSPAGSRVRFALHFILG